MLILTVPETSPSLPLRDFLRRHNGLSLTAWRKIKRSGILLINNLPAPPGAYVNPGDVITIQNLNECKVTPMFLPLTIRYEDEQLLVADKPAGILVHPSNKPDEPTLANAVMHYFQEQNLHCGFHPVQRLDRNTSGLVLISKNPHIQHLLSANGIKQVKRQYLAVATGIPCPSSGTIDLPIGRHPDSIIERRVHPDGQKAVTHYTVIENLNIASLLELELETGRTHQLRVHLAHIGHPILGDDLYGGSTELISRQALHAAKLHFVNPLSGKDIYVCSPLPDDLTLLLSKLRI